MTPERWRQVKDVLRAAWERDAGERSAFLDQALAHDVELRAHVEALLASDESIGEFLATPAIDLARAQSAGRSLLAASVAEDRLIQAVSRAIEYLPGDTYEGSEQIGARVGRYCITGLIGKGGMGAVYRAEREDDFRMQVAIKLLKRGTDTESALMRFRAERQILAGLEHPNIARLLDGGATETGLPYFVMEYVDGTPLLEYAATLPVRQRLDLFRTVCSAVQCAHQNRVVHRDLKPSNILVTPQGIPKLLDFGIAKLLDPDSKGAPTAGGLRLMTPDYASPEQVRGEPVTTATDVYSLGAVLYELLTGQRAYHFEVSSPEAIEHEISTREPRKPSVVNKRLDPDLDNIVLKALRKEPERRYVSVAQFSDDLGRFLRDLPVEARKESLLYRGRKFLKRNRAPAITAVLGPALALIVVAGLRQLGGPREDIRSIAVLPLENISGDREQEYFADGVTDALISELSRIRALRVISRTSVMTYKGLHRPLPEIARRLGVQTIAEGSVLRAGNRVRIALRLVDAPKERPMWSGSYEGELRDVLALQSQVARAIAGEIDVTLAASDKGRVSRHPRVDLDAYDAYLKGRHQYLTEFNPKSMEKAVALFQQAITLDPDYAPAYAGLADCYYIVSNQYYAPTEVMPKARSAALRAIELDDTLGEAHATLALIRSVYEFNRAEAEKGFKRAIEIKPSDAQAHLWYALHLVGMGRFDEAAAEVEQAQKLDPVSPALNGYVGPVLYYAHRYDQVIQRMQPIIEKYPDYQQPYAWLALAYEQKGEWAKAIAAMERSTALDGGEVDGLAQLGHIYAGSGRTADARKILRRVRELSRRRYVTVWDYALLYAGMGERDEAFRWLQKIEEDRSEMFALVNVDPRFEALHADPRFADLLRKVGLGR